MWIQLLTGAAPTSSLTLTQSGVTATSGTVTGRDLSFPFCGVFTGSNLIGAYGFGIEALDLVVGDILFDLDNAQALPENLVTITIEGLISGEDYILVGPATGSGGTLDLDQLALNGTLSGAAVTSVVVSGSIPADTPATGKIRIQRDDGSYSKHSYTSWTGSTFTIGSTDFSSNNATTGNNVFIAYIDELASGTTAQFQTTYVSPRVLFVRRRDGGAASPTKTYESTFTLGSANQSVSVQRLTDA